MLASASSSLCVWRVSEQFELQQVQRVPSVAQYNCVSWNHTNKVVAVGGNDKKLSLYQSSNGELLSTIPFSDGGAYDVMQGNVKTLTFSNTSKYLACGADSIVYIYDLKRRQCKSKFIGHKGQITALDFSISNNEVIACDSVGAMRIWNMKTFDSSEEMILVDNQVGITCMEVSALGPSRVTTGYENGALSLWDLESKTSIRKMNLHNGALTSLSYSPKNPRLVATVGSDGRLSLVDTSSKSNTPSAHIDIGDRLTSTSFYENAIHCAVGTNSGSILLYDWRNVRLPVCKIDAHNPYPVMSLKFSHRIKSESTSITGSTTSLPSASSVTSPMNPKKDKATEALSTASVVSALSNKTEKVSTTEDSTDRLVKSIQSSQDKKALQSLIGSLTPTRANPTNIRNSHDTNISVSTISDDNSYVDQDFIQLTAQLEKAVTSSGIKPASSISPARVGNKVSEKTAPGLGSIPTPISLSATSTSPVVKVPPQPPRDSVVNSISSINSARSIISNDPTTGSSTSITRGNTEPIIASSSKATDNSIGSSLGIARGSNLRKNTEQQAAPSSKAMDSALMESLQNSLSKVVTSNELQEQLALLKYDIHKELQGVIREQIRQHTISKDETVVVIERMFEKMNELLEANKELRIENERLRRIY